MEEREALKRQIDLLQNLINRHKSVHGDAPFTGVEQRRPEAQTSARRTTTSVNTSVPPTSVGRAPGSRGGRHDSHARSWNKTFSLRNKNPPGGSSSTQQHSSATVSQPASVGLSQSESQREKERPDSVVGGGVCGTIQKRTTEALRKKEPGAVAQKEAIKGGSSSTGICKAQPRTEEPQQSADSRRVVLPEKTVGKSSEVPSKVEARTPAGLQSCSHVDAKPSDTHRTSIETKQTAILTTLTAPKVDPPLSLVSKVPKLASIDPTAAHTNHSRSGGAASFSKKSKFTWVKSQTVRVSEPRQASPISSPLSTGKAGTVSSTMSVSKSAAPSSSPYATSKKTPPKRLSRKHSPASVAAKTSKYKWVSSSAGSQGKISRKTPSPRALSLSQRVLERGEAMKRVRATQTPSPKIRKGNATSSSSSSNPSPGSRYRWKAGGPSTSVAVTGSSLSVSKRKSAFHWTAERGVKSPRGGPVGVGAPSPSGTHRGSFTASSPGAFKLRSRMKIIRKSANSVGGSEKWSSPSSVRFSPRNRLHSWTRTPPGVSRATHSGTRAPAGLKRTPSRELVSFGRHKLRRLSPNNAARTSPSPSSHRSPSSSQRVFRTRYKMETRTSAHAPHWSLSRPHAGATSAHTPHWSHQALSWRAKRIHSARTFLQSRLRTPPADRQSANQWRAGRQPANQWRAGRQPTNQWRGSSMCWIRGSLFRVSANKLSRTVAASMSINRTGRSYGAAPGSATSPSHNPFTTRHLASRAVQRSLAIIRSARHKKLHPHTQYCMYYNRFGRCNRGNACPFIHDPDKVAVCTRFLRGTCKKADGTCPFSHKVAKEKMPVCSYFLRGVCTNSDCPYSHVYVSRNAQVCEHFVKGYCPDGEKCKKKHTLLCPDFSKSGTCPRGPRCKLQHRQAAKRTHSTPNRRHKTRETAKRPRLSVLMPEESQAAPQTPEGAVAPPPSASQTPRGALALPSFISLCSSPEEADAPHTQQAALGREKKLQIKPRLKLQTEDACQ